MPVEVSPAQRSSIGENRNSELVRIIHERPLTDRDAPDRRGCLNDRAELLTTAFGPTGSNGSAFDGSRERGETPRIGTAH